MYLKLLGEIEAPASARLSIQFHLLTDFCIREGVVLPYRLGNVNRVNRWVAGDRLFIAILGQWTCSITHSTQATNADPSLCAVIAEAPYLRGFKRLMRLGTPKCLSAVLTNI